MQSHPIQRVLETVNKWLNQDHIEIHEINRFYSSVRECIEREKPLQGLIVLQTYCDWLLHSKIEYSRHMHMVKNLNLALNSQEGLGIWDAEGDSNEWIREMYRVVFNTRELADELGSGLID